MKQLALFLIGIFFGGGLGFLIAASQGVTLDGHDHADPAQHHGTHAALDLPSSDTAPTLAVHLIKDTKGGWNLHVATDNFRFAPENVNAANVEGEGHAHVYVDGRKIARLYGPWMHFDNLPAGATLRVELNANDHSPLSVAGQALSVDVQVPSQ